MGRESHQVGVQSFGGRDRLPEGIDGQREHHERRTDICRVSGTTALPAAAGRPVAGPRRPPCSRSPSWRARRRLRIRCRARQAAGATGHPTTDPAAAPPRPRPRTVRRHGGGRPRPTTTPTTPSVMPRAARPGEQPGSATAHAGERWRDPARRRHAARTPRPCDDPGDARYGRAGGRPGPFDAAARDGLRPWGRVRRAGAPGDDRRAPGRAGRPSPAERSPPLRRRSRAGAATRLDADDRRRRRDVGRRGGVRAGDGGVSSPPSAPAAPAAAPPRAPRPRSPPAAAAPPAAPAPRPRRPVTSRGLGPRRHAVRPGRSPTRADTPPTTAAAERRDPRAGHGRLRTAHPTSRRPGRHTGRGRPAGRPSRVRLLVERRSRGLLRSKEVRSTARPAARRQAAARRGREPTARSERRRRPRARRSSHCSSPPRCSWRRGHGGRSAQCRCG